MSINEGEMSLLVYNLMCLIKKNSLFCFLSVGYIPKEIFHVRMI